MLPNRFNRSARAALLVITAAVAAGCSDDSTGPEETETVTIGGLFSLTGNWNTLGLASKAALELAVEDINVTLATGTSSLRFEAMVEDTKLDPALALTAAQRLRQNGVTIALGPQSSAEVAALKTYVDANGLLIVSQSSTAATLMLPNDNILRLTPGDSLEALAISALMRADGITATIPVWRADPGNRGLATGTRARMTALGATVSAGHEYSATETNFAATVAALGVQVRAALATRPASQVAVVLSAFDEAVQLFRAAAGDPVLASVKWYGTDGTARSAAIENDAQAAAFVTTVGFANPLPGLHDDNTAKWQPIAARIRTRSGQEADAFALAVYDGAWLAAEAYAFAGADANAALLRTQMLRAAASFHGTTGATTLNAAGDRSNGNFDFFELRRVGANYDYVRVGQYDTGTAVLRR